MARQVHQEKGWDQPGASVPLLECNMIRCELAYYCQFTPGLTVAESCSTGRAYSTLSERLSGKRAHIMNGKPGGTRGGIVGLLAIPECTQANVYGVALFQLHVNRPSDHSSIHRNINLLCQINLGSRGVTLVDEGQGDATLLSL